jgi:hypothetical protein
MSAVEKLREIQYYLIPKEEFIAAIEISNKIKNLIEIAKIDTSLGDEVARGIREPHDVISGVDIIFKKVDPDCEYMQRYSKFVEDFNKQYKHTWKETMIQILRPMADIYKFPLNPDEMYKNHTDLMKGMDSDPIKVKDWGVWLFKGYLYHVDNKYKYNDEEAKLLVLEEYDKDRKRFERLKQKYGSRSGEKFTYLRPRIPESVRIEVWRRDNGKCARCGSRENLEYDHIVPISRGGSNTARNIELLCEKCNRSKSNNVV